MEPYLREFERTLRLTPTEARAIVAEVRGNLEDLIGHLRAQGYGPGDAEEEAVRRFDDAGGLARAIRRQHRPAPLTLRALAVVLVVVGLGELMLFLSVVQTIVAANTHGGGFDAGLRLLPSGPGQPYFAQSPETLVKNLAPEAAIVICSVVSLWAAYTVLRYHRRYHWRRTGVGVVGALAIDVAFLYALSYTFTRRPRAGRTPAPSSCPTPPPWRRRG